MRAVEGRVARQRKRRRSIVLVILGLFLFAAAAWASFWWFDSPQVVNHVVHDKTMMVAQDKKNIMVMGVDERTGDVGRSDTLFVATMDMDDKKMAMLSIPRDTRVKIAGHGYEKINHAYAYGGHTLARSTLEGLLGMPIDNYVLIDFQAFRRIIDAIGGVDIDVEKRMYYNDPYDGKEGLHIDLRPGPQHMDGKTAIQYVRYRDEEGDIGRIARQQKFLKAVLEKASSPSIITRLPSIIQEVSSAVRTDLSLSEMINMLSILKEAQQKGLKTDMLPGTPAYVNDVSYWIPDVAGVRRHLAQTLGVTMSESAARAMQQEVDQYKASIPKEMKIAEPPKKEPAKAKTSGAPGKTAEAAAAAEKPKPKSERARPAIVKVEIVNASGSPSAGREVASILRARGFEVTEVSNLTTTYKNTVVVANTSESGVLNKLSALPFRYSLQVNRGDDQGAPVSVVIGKDYTGRY